MMTVKKTRKDSALTVAVSGRLDSASAPELESALKGALDGVTELVFDLKGLVYVSSAGLRIFLSTLKVMNTRGTMTLINVGNEVMEIFEVTAFDEILNISGA